jgi:membrane fusion protein (multidrug efflux system)
VQKDQVIAEVDPSRPGMKYVNSPVKSPISGTIISILAQVGTTINQAVPIAKISKMDEIQIKTALSERYISKIKLGLDALLRFEAYPDERFSTRITEVSPVVDPLTRTIEVRLNLLKYDKRIKVGMFAEVKIITQKKKNIIKIPADCLVKRYGGYYVFVVKDGQVERRKVNPGIQIDNKLEITEGLIADEEVVMQGQTLLEDKAKVRVVEQIQPLTAQDVIE